jgi:hypothetical protein
MRRRLHREVFLGGDQLVATPAYGVKGATLSGEGAGVYGVSSSASTRPGQAFSAAPRRRPRGTVLGKAQQAQDKGTGTIRMLVTLQ